MSLGTGPALASFVALHAVQFIHIQGCGVSNGPLITHEAFQSSLWLVCGIVLNSNVHSLQLIFFIRRVCGSLQENLRSEGDRLPERMFAVQEYDSGHGP